MKIFSVFVPEVHPIKTTLCTQGEKMGRLFVIRRGELQVLRVLRNPEQPVEEERVLAVKPKVCISLLKVLD